MKTLALAFVVLSLSACGVRRGMTREEARHEIQPVKITTEGDLETWTYYDWKSRVCQVKFFQGRSVGKGRCNIPPEDVIREANRAKVMAAEAANKRTTHCQSRTDARGITVTDCD